MIKLPTGEYADKAYEKLSPRNKEIIDGLRIGNNANVIAIQYDISPTQVTSIINKYKRMIEREKYYDTDKNHIYNLDLSTRTYNALMRSDISTIEKLVETIRDPDKVSKIRNLGPTGYNEIVEKLKDFGYILEKKEIRELKKFFTMFGPGMSDKMSIILFIKAYNVQDAKEIAFNYAQNNKNLKSMIMTIIPIEIKDEMFITENDIKEI